MNESRGSFTARKQAVKNRLAEVGLASWGRTPQWTQQPI